MIGDLDFALDLRHADPRQLRISLIAPDGARVVLWDRQAGDSGVQANWDDDLNLKVGASKEALAKLDGRPAAGKWRLLVEDFQQGNRGSLRHFAITMRPRAVTRSIPKVSAASPNASMASHSAPTAAAAGRADWLSASPTVKKAPPDRQLPRAELRESFARSTNAGLTARGADRPERPNAQNRNDVSRAEFPVHDELRLEDSMLDRVWAGWDPVART